MLGKLRGALIPRQDVAAVPRQCGLIPRHPQPHRPVCLIWANAQGPRASHTPGVLTRGSSAEPSLPLPSNSCFGRSSHFRFAVLTCALVSAGFGRYHCNRATLICGILISSDSALLVAANGLSSLTAVANDRSSCSSREYHDLDDSIGVCSEATPVWRSKAIFRVRKLNGNVVNPNLHGKNQNVVQNDCPRD